jgi:DNA helicase-2/ATP-dependent DNA helicase PcrA
VSEPLAALSDEQAVAALYPVRDRHLLILARPGSGKTYTLAARARFLLEEGVDPHQILAMTFSRRAALELRERLPGGEIWAGTFHAICADILEKHGAAAGVRWPFRIVDEARCRELIAQAAGTLGCHLPSERRARDRFLHEVARRVGRRKRLGRDGHEESPEYRIPAEVVERIDEYYGQLLRDANALDYCDLISRAIEAIDGDAATAEALQQRLAFLLVDEFHDISPEQYRLVTLLAAARGGSQVLVVGDPDQAIYGWRGANVTRMLRHYRAEYQPREFHLTTNFRSRAAIVAAADALLGAERATRPSGAARAGGHRPAWCLQPDEAREAAAVARLIRGAVESGRYRDYGAFAVLYRTHATGDAVEAALLRTEIPVWRVQNQRFFDDPDAQESLRLLELVVGLHGEGFEPALNWPRVIVDEVTMAHLRRLARGKGMGLTELMRHAHCFPHAIGPVTRGVIREFLATFGEEMKPLVELPITEVLEPFLAGLASRRSPIARAERPLLRDTLDLVERTLRPALAPLAAAVRARRAVRLECSDNADAIAAAIIVRHVLHWYFSVEPCDADRGLSGGGDPFVILLGEEREPDRDGIGIGPLPTRTVELTVAARAWRLMQMLLMACERDHDGEFLLLDIETTAIDLQRAEILEYAAIPFVKGESRPEAGIGALVRPSHPGAIAREATDIRGLRWSDVADAEDMAAHLPLLADTLRDQIVVGHNIDDFDMPQLRRVASEGERPLGAVETIDTRQMARRLWPDEMPYRLEDLARRSDLTMTQRHRAAADCLLTGQLFGELLAATRRDREIDLLSECLPLVAASIVASFDVVANDNALLAACGARAWSLGHGRALLQRWIRGAGDDRAIRVRDILDAQCPEDGEEDARWERLVTGWRGAVEAFCVGERDRSLPRFLHYAALAQPIDTHAPASGGERGDPRALPHAQRVALMTVHSAKGLEWDAVVMVGMEEG